MKIIAETKSICEICNRVIPAHVVEKDGKTFINKECSEHGKSTHEHVWDDPEIYKGLSKITVLERSAAQIIVDTTRKCNLNCLICFANANQYKGNEFKQKDLDRLKDYQLIFLSGGEPTVRKDLDQLIKRCVKNGQKPVLFTNGVKLTNKKYLKKLHRAGLRSVLFQFDSLDDNDCQYVRGKKLVKEKIKALKNLNDFKIPVSIWSVIMKNRNLKDIEKLHRFVLKYPCVKTVSAIPIWQIGRYNPDDFLPPSTIIKKLCKIYGVQKSDFISTTRLLCNLDRFLSLLNSQRGRLFGVCMIKLLLFKHKDKYIPITKVLDVNGINKRIENICQKPQGKITSIIFFLIYLFINQGIVNFFKNKYFRRVVSKPLANSRHIFTAKLLTNPFFFVTVGIFPNNRNIDLKFIEPCNSYALSCDDYSVRPACLHYINFEKKSKY